MILESTWLNITTWPVGAQIILTLLAMVVAAGLIVLLFFAVKKERQKYKDEKLSFIEGVLSKSEILAEVNTYISKVSYDTTFTLAFFSIDKIDEIRSAFSDQTVKSVVESVAAKLLKTLSFRVMVGRYSTDTLLLIFKNEYEKAEVVNTLNQLRNNMREQIKVTGTDVNITCSVGIVYFPKDGQSTKQLIDSLQIASYMAMKDGGNRTIIYSREMGEEEGETVQYYTQVKRAVENKEFVLYYQPVVEFEHGKVVAAEALLRWNHPELGILNPQKFINILEQSGDIYFVAVWSLELMIQAYNTIKREHAIEDFELSMNLSPKQLMSDTLANDFQRILKKYKMTGKNLIVEMSEFLIFEQQEVVRTNILKLKQLGFKVAVDGFALDNNTLLKIKDFPIDIIKIDSSSLVDEENSFLQQRLTELLIDHAKQNNIEIILERVENKGTVLIAKQEGIFKGQGYYFSKPVDFDSMNKYLNDKDNNNLAKVTEGMKVIDRTEKPVKQDNVEIEKPQEIEKTVTDEGINNITNDNLNGEISSENPSEVTQETKTKSKKKSSK